jgi:hypothetical protein
MEEGIAMSVQAEQIDEWIGSEVVDGNDEKLGKVAEVYYRGAEPVVVEIRTGLIGRKLSLAALNGAAVSMKHLRLGVAETIETDGGIDAEALELLARSDNRLQGIGVDDLESASERKARLEAAEQAAAHADTMEAEARHRAEEATSLAQVAQEAADNAAAAQQASQKAQADAVEARQEADRVKVS